MDAIEIAVLLGVVIILGFIATGVITDWEFGNLATEVKRQMLDEKGNLVKMDTQQMAGTIADYAAACREQRRVPPEQSLGRQGLVKLRCRIEPFAAGRSRPCGSAEADGEEPGDFSPAGESSRRVVAAARAIERRRERDRRGRRRRRRRDRRGRDRRRRRAAGEESEQQGECQCVCDSVVGVVHQ